MPTDCIPFRETNYFSSLICDYLDENEPLKPFYNRFPKLENFKAQIEEKQSSFTDESRTVLVKSLNKQYQNSEVSDLTQTNINLLQNTNTFTVVTGHQLNLFTGPLYFFYKIISTINLCKELKVQYPEYDFVPIYWMATEDHDFEEINYFNFKGKKVQWSRDASGAVGELNLKSLDLVFEVFSAQLNGTTNASELKKRFKDAYLNHSNLAEAMHQLVNDLFKDFGLVIVDGNDKTLKQQFIPYVEEELVKQTSFSKVSEANENLNALDGNYKIQVNPREINLFYITENVRERIVEKDTIFYVNNTDVSWDKSEILKEVYDFPERFSPNVILRPLFQEVVLPNLCYIGGGGELAYWLELKSNFESQNVVFPMLLLRNSVVLITEKQKQKLDKLHVEVSDLFLNQEALKTKITKQISAIDIDFSSQVQHLKQQFEALYDLAEKTDGSFIGAVAAQEQKQVKGLENLEKRLLKAQKRKLSDHIRRVVELQNELFPNQSLQERYMNFSEFYLDYGSEFIPKLIDSLKPLKGEFSIVQV
ncbi:bacillithiol biosynthesis cysteine-adding enzyme BshC [Psychroserpens ponticola]|uniref:Putative cysteine ligase BshC n=1 Tax=Psychroserpens ponticola TaxID=2932268 RepID=A0ABY7S0Y5_9FLAO|nr:bacillithiol biosynthesis cysteine-adding enzyme BshC [Psychroserpens ponticola]WCO02672.1 bacillithiol biosynthesis cysteine-adding enzyme BshC [Psychroserpens ponticola]